MLHGERRYANLSAANGQRGSHGRIFWECCAVVRGVRGEDDPRRSALCVALRENLLRVWVRGTPHALGSARTWRDERIGRGGRLDILPISNRRPLTRRTPRSRATADEFREQESNLRLLIQSQASCR